MNRNVESHFATLPSIDIERSIFDLSHENKLSFNAGDLVPIYYEECLPGDSFRLTSSKVVRAQTMLTPVMDNMYLDTYFFFVPNRIIFDKWPEVMGENNASAWLPQVEYVVPSISSPSGGFNLNTLADYFHMPVGVQWSATDPGAPNVLPFRGYAKICQDWFVDENLTDPLNIPTGTSNQSGSNGTDYINDVANGGAPFVVCKYHDYFTSCLPSPQKGNSVTFGTTASLSGYAPVGTLSERITVDPDKFGDFSLKLLDVSGSTVAEGNHALYAGKESANDYMTGRFNTATSSVSSFHGFAPSNLWADLDDVSVGGVSFTINELRLAFQLQKFYEKNARCGSNRYIEVIKAHFGITSPDARLQRSEYLGGNRIPLNVHEVTNSAQSSSDFLGDLGAKSATSDIHEDFEYSCTEHGAIIGVMCVRTDKTYSQGMPKKYTRKKFSDFYWPVFANIGEQPVYDREIYADATTLANDTVFGYQEAYAEYRYASSNCAGEMRPGVANTLASWHFGDYYTQKPTLSDAWIREDKTNIDRTLAVSSANANQFFADLYFEVYATRPMPTYSIPGLIDHH